jgi:hypothetical protein
MDTSQVWPTRVFSSGTLLRIAEKGVRRSKREPDQAIVAVLFSAASVEAFVNDLMEVSAFTRNDEKSQLLHDVLSEAEDQKASVMMKLQLTCRILTGTRMDRGSRVFQDVELLFKLRNHLIHMRPILQSVISSRLREKSTGQEIN